jgi:uncharacterized OB-fold protein
MGETRSRIVAAPPADAESRPYFEAAAQGRLVTRKCVSCEEVHFYPRSLCPFCGAADPAWVELSGKGAIYSCSVTRRAGPVPYAIAYVALDEGVSMLTNIVDCDLDALRIGQRVEVVFRPAEDGAAVPMFTPERARR